MNNNRRKHRGVYKLPPTVREFKSVLFTVGEYINEPPCTGVIFELYARLPPALPLHLTLSYTENNMD